MSNNWTPPLLETRDLCRSFREEKGRLQILAGINFTLQKGEIVTIIGRSGSGKSTFLNLLGALDHPSSGEIFIDGVSLAEMSPAELDHCRLTKLGFIFQFHHLLPEMTALDNLLLPARILGTSERRAKDRAFELLETVGLSDRAKYFPGKLSGGERQRVAVARALMNNPAIVLADEPSGNLDESHAGDLHALFTNLNRRFNQAFVIVTHDLTLAALGHRNLRMHQGVLEPSEEGA